MTASNDSVRPRTLSAPWNDDEEKDHKQAGAYTGRKPCKMEHHYIQKNIDWKPVQWRTYNFGRGLLR